MLPVCPNDPPRVPLCLWRGDTLPIPEWLFGTEAEPADLTGSIFRLDVEWWPSRISLGSQPGARSWDCATPTDPAGGVQWPTWSADVTVIPRGARVSYALRRLIGGTVETWAQGPITLNGFLGSADSGQPSTSTAVGLSGNFGQVRYGEMMGAAVTSAEANTDVPFIVTAPRDVISDLRGPFANFDFLDAQGILRARKAGDSYLLSLRVTVVPQIAGGWVKIAIYIAGNISGLNGATSERTVPLTESAGSPHRIDELFQLFPRTGFIANGARIMIRASVPVDLSQETLFITPLEAAP